MGKTNIRPIEYYEGIFDVFKQKQNLDDWAENQFAEIMWGLGFDMDCNHSFEEYKSKSLLKVKEPEKEREQKRNDLYYLEHADLQVVGNCLFSYWRYYTHWAYCYDEYDIDFLRRIITILEEKYKTTDKGIKKIDLTIEEYLKSINYPAKMAALGETGGFRYYVETDLPEDEDIGLPFVVIENINNHTFEICNADSVFDVLNMFA